jgi:hypothetical protein
MPMSRITPGVLLRRLNLSVGLFDNSPARAMDTTGNWRSTITQNGENFYVKRIDVGQERDLIQAWFNVGKSLDVNNVIQATVHAADGNNVAHEIGLPMIPCNQMYGALFAFTETDDLFIASTYPLVTSANFVSKGYSPTFWTISDSYVGREVSFSLAYGLGYDFVHSNNSLHLPLALNRAEPSIDFQLVTTATPSGVEQKKGDKEESKN